MSFADVTRNCSSKFYCKEIISRQFIEFLKKFPRSSREILNKVFPISMNTK